MKKKNPMAVALGKLGKHKKKTLTPEQREAKRKALAEVREKRWPHKSQDSNA